MFQFMHLALKLFLKKNLEQTLLEVDAIGATNFAVLTDGIAVTIAMFLSNLIKDYVQKSFADVFVKHPAMSIAGTMFATLVVIGVQSIYYYIINPQAKKKAEAALQNISQDRMLSMI